MLLALKAFAVIASLAWLLVLLLAWRFQERLVWQPPSSPTRPRAHAAVRRVDYAAEDGQPLFGYLVTPDGRDGRGDGVLLSFHGNAETAADNVPWALEVARRTGWAVLLAEWRGYAGLAGAPGYATARLDARAAYRWLREALGAPAGRVALAGYSLGTAVAVELAAEVAPAAVLLHAPFTSMRDMARAAVPWWLAAAWPLIGRVHFDTRGRVAEIDAPVSVALGDADAVVPPWMGRAVHAAARRPGELLVVAGAGHVDLEARGGERYWAFVSRALAAARAGPER